MNSAGHTEAIFWLRPLISVSRRVAYVIDLGVGGVKGYPNWTGGIELRWVDTRVVTIGPFHRGLYGMNLGHPLHLSSISLKGFPFLSI